MPVQNKTQPANKTFFQKKQLERVLTPLLKQVESVKEETDLDKIFETVGEKLSSVNIATLILIWDKSKGRIYLRHISLPDNLSGIFAKYHKKEDFQIPDNKATVYKKVIDSKKPLYQSKYTEEILRAVSVNSRLSSKLPSAGSVVCPMMLKGEIIGFIEFISSSIGKENLEQFSQFSRALIDNIANTLLYQELRRSEARFKELWNHAPVAYHTLDKRGNILDVNQTEADMLGYKREEMIGRRIFDFISPKQRESAKKRFRMKLSGTKVPKTNNRIYIKKNGDPIYVAIDDVLERDEDGRIAGVRTTMVNISNRIQTEEALRQSEYKYHNIFDHAPVSIIELDLFDIKLALEGLRRSGVKDVRAYLSENIDYTIGLLKKVKTKDVNSRCLKRFGARSRDEFVNSLHKVFMDEDISAFIDMLSAMDKKKQNYKRESVIRKIRGGKQHVLVSIDFPRKKSAYQSIIVGIMDITKRKQAEVALKESEDKYRSLINNAMDIVLLLDTEGKITFVNRAFTEILGYTEDEGVGMPVSRLLHPDNRKQTMERFRRRVRRDNTESRTNVIKVLSKSGELFYIEYIASPIIKDGEVRFVQVIARDITENRILQQSIEQSKQHYEQVIDTIQESICVVGKDCRVISMNKMFAEKTGTPVNRTKGARFQDLVLKNNGTGCLFGFPCASCGKNSCEIDRAFNTGELVTAENEYMDKKGKTFYYLSRFFPAKNREGQVSQVVIAIQDITKQKQGELEIARLSEFNQRIFDAAPVSIVVVDAHGYIIAANWLARSLMDQPHGAMIGSRLTETPEIENNPELSEQYKDLLQKGRPLYYHNLCYREEKTGQKKFLNVIAVPLFGQNQQIEGAISMALDNTQSVLARRKQDKLNEELEQKVAERTWQLDQLNKKLLRVLDLKSKFLTDASHELRTPLTVIQGNLDLAIQERKYENKKVPEIFNTIMKEVEQMTGILSDLSLLTNADDGVERISMESVDLRDVIDTIIQSLDVLAGQKGVKLRGDKLKQAVIVEGDEAKLEKMLSNIVRNAIKYNKEGGRVDIGLKQGPEGVYLRVKDDGIGIPRQEIPNIFERFYRVDKARSASEGGTGLGLSICKWIAEAHGGRIEVESEVGKGSVFTVFLPNKEYRESRRNLFS